MADGLAGHIADLTYNPEAEAEEAAGEVTPDSLLEDPVDTESSALPDRILGSEEPEEVVSDVSSKEEKSDTSNTDELLAAVRAESQGRLGEITRLRTENRETAQALNSLREMFLAMEKRQEEEEAERRRALEYQEEVERFGEDVVNDPTAAYIAEKVAKVDDTLLAQKEYEEHQRQQINAQVQAQQQRKQAEAAMFQTAKVQEEAFLAEHPDYYDAYDHARTERAKWYQSRGYDAKQAESIVDQETYYLLQEQVQRGGNVAEQVYNLAKQWGYTPQQAQAAAEQASQEQPRDQVENYDLGRMKAGLGSQGIGQIPGGASPRSQNVGGRTYSVEEFFKTVPRSQRIQIFMNDPNAFETLGRTGQITLHD